MRAGIAREKSQHFYEWIGIHDQFLFGHFKLHTYIVHINSECNMPSKKDYSYQAEQDVHRITLYNTVYPEHQHRARKDRLYIHFDFACFYAQVEQLRKNLYGIPLIVGGWRKENGTVKGIVATSSYEARAMGIKTGMSAYEAYKHCPYVCMLQVDYASYTAISKQVHHILNRYSHRIERYSMDEYFMDGSFLLGKEEPQIRRFGEQLQQEICEATGLYGSIGIARSKTYAKLASGLNKPRGISLILSDEDERMYIHPLPLNEVWGVGRRRYEHLLAEGYATIRDVVTHNQVDTFIRLFGPHFGRMLFQTITGQDQGRILEENDEYSPKWGVSYGHTFSEGSTDAEAIKGEFAIGIEMICYRMRAYGIRASSFGGMIGFDHDHYPNIGVRFVTPSYTHITKYVYDAFIHELGAKIDAFCSQGMAVRNLILGTQDMDKTSQMNLFFRDEQEQTERYKAIDHINNRYGKGTIQSARSLYRVEGNTHFLERNSG